MNESTLLTTLASSLPTGPTSVIWVRALSLGVSQWLRTLVVRGVTTGVIGSGTVVGAFTFSGTSDMFVGGWSGFGVMGPNVGGMATALASGLNAGMSGWVYRGASTGVGSGTDVSSVIVLSSGVDALATILEGYYRQQCQLMGGTGPVDSRFLRGLAVGIGLLTLTGVGVGVVSPGVVSPGSALGSSVGSLT